MTIVIDEEYYDEEEESEENWKMEVNLPMYCKFDFESDSSENFENWKGPDKSMKKMKKIMRMTV